MKKISLFLFTYFVLPINVFALDYVPLSGDNSPLGSLKTNDVNTLLDSLFKWGISIAVILATLVLIWGGFLYMTTDAVGKKEDGKNKIKGALGGLILALSSWAILNTINPQILSTPLDFSGLRSEGGAGGDNSGGGSVTGFVSNPDQVDTDPFRITSTIDESSTPTCGGKSLVINTKTNESFFVLNFLNTTLNVFNKFLEAPKVFAEEKLNVPEVVSRRIEELKGGVSTANKESADTYFFRRDEKWKHQKGKSLSPDVVEFVMPGSTKKTLSGGNADKVIVNGSEKIDPDVVSEVYTIHDHPTKVMSSLLSTYRENSYAPPSGPDVVFSSVIASKELNRPSGNTITYRNFVVEKNGVWEFSVNKGSKAWNAALFEASPDLLLETQGTNRLNATESGFFAPMRKICTDFFSTEAKRSTATTTEEYNAANQEWIQKMRDSGVNLKFYPNAGSSCNSSGCSN